VRRVVSRRVAIIGGGLAGLSAAVRLCETDPPHEVVLIETRRKLGGRATSFTDPRTGEVLDNCQHVLMGCCTNLIDFYDRIGVIDMIQWHRELYWAAKGDGSNGAAPAHVDVVRPGLLPAPLHFLGSFRRMRILQRADKRAIARAMWRMIRMGSAGRLRWTERTFAAFLAECNQTRGAVERFWSPIVVSACNMAVERVCAAHAIQVFQEGFLAGAWSAAMGLSAVPLAQLYDPAAAFIEERGGRIMLGVSARAIGYDGARVTGVTTDEGEVHAAAVVAAVPFDRLEKLASSRLRSADARLRSLDGFEVSPILGVHLRFERPVMDLPHLVLVPGEGVQWLFNKGVDESGSQHVHAVISAADSWMALEEREIVARVLEDVRSALPAARGQEPIAARSVKEKRATFAAVPGVDEQRPRAAPGTIGLGGGGVPNLFLAGDWCDTGWPATMEGAVRSGYLAAGAVAGTPMLIEDVPPGPLARWLGLG
jgi:hydroxysqualene dehydroxylase